MGSCDGGGVASGTVSENKGTKGIRNWYLIRKTRETLPTIKMNESTKISTSYMKPFPFFELKMCWAWCLVCQLHPPSFLERKKGIKKMWFLEPFFKMSQNWQGLSKTDRNPWEKRYLCLVQWDLEVNYGGKAPNKLEMKQVLEEALRALGNRDFIMLKKDTQFRGIWQHLPRMLSILNKPATAKMTKMRLQKLWMKMHKQNVFSALSARSCRSPARLWFNILQPKIVQS